jgi:hypothetical protein
MLTLQSGPPLSWGNAIYYVQLNAHRRMVQHSI